MLEDNRFETAVQAVNERPRAHINELQPRLAAAGIKERTSYTTDELSQRLGEELVLRMQRATDAAVEQVDLSVESCAALVKRFHGAMKSRFPTESIIHMAPNSPSNK